MSVNHVQSDDDKEKKRSLEREYVKIIFAHDVDLSLRGEAAFL